jgi:molybdopterin-guanine dinucleotide biosynthesis protein A
MGRDKALLELDGEPLAGRAARVLQQAGCDPVLVVGSQPSLPALGWVTVDDGAGELPRHPLHGVIAALQASPHPLVLVVPCDLPALEAPDLAPLLATGGPAVATAGGRLQPLVCVLHRSALDRARQLLAEGAPARALVAGLPQVGVPQRAVVNLNRPEQLASWRHGGC